MHNPLASEVPIRKPVYEPGPLLTATASGMKPFVLAKETLSSAKTPSRAAWEGPWYETFSKTTSPFSDNATEQTGVDVSMCNIHAIFHFPVFHAKLQKQIHPCRLCDFFTGIIYLCGKLQEKMIQSMTGFGKVTAELPSKRVTIEIKSLNSKQFDLNARISAVYREKELEIRNELLQTLERGKIELSIYIENIGKETAAKINLPVVESYFEQIKTLSEHLHLAEPSDWFQTLLRMPDTIKNDMAELEESEWTTIHNAIGEAVRQLTGFRTQEGAMLQKLFEEKIASIADLLARIDRYEGERIEKVKSRILDNLKKLNEVDYDKNRFEQELIYYIEKLDINEEKSRLDNHLKYFTDTLNQGRGQGKKLGFIAQEMGREINTLGSKSNHVEMQKIVVEMKDALEQIKEQVLNVL
jgi:uncharacterized protein (TIGR00255 family)